MWSSNGWVQSGRLRIESLVRDFTDGFGMLLKGAVCKSHALDFYGDVACKAEAITAHSIACYEVAQREQLQNCTMPAYVAEINDYVER